MLKNKWKLLLFALLIIASLIAIGFGIYKYSEVGFIYKYKDDFEDIVFNGYNSMKTLNDMKQFADDYESDNFKPYVHNVIDTAIDRAPDKNNYTIYTAFYVNDTHKDELVLIDIEENVDDTQSFGTITIDFDIDYDPEYSIDFYREVVENTTTFYLCVDNTWYRYLTDFSFFDIGKYINDLKTAEYADFPRTSSGIFDAVSAISVKYKFEQKIAVAKFNAAKLDSISAISDVDPIGYRSEIMTIVNELVNDRYEIATDRTIGYYFTNVSIMNATIPESVKSSVSSEQLPIISID